MKPSRSTSSTRRYPKNYRKKLENLTRGGYFRGKSMFLRGSETANFRGKSITGLQAIPFADNHFKEMIRLRLVNVLSISFLMLPYQTKLGAAYNEAIAHCCL